MWRSAFGLCLLLTAIHGGDLAEPDPKYMLLVPTVLKAKNNQKFCLQFSHLNESVTVTVALETGAENITLLEKQVTQPDEDNCVTFKTPDTDKANVGYITLEAEGSTLHFKKRRRVLIKPLENLVFIQTDKPIYKPGQHVKFRIAALDETFHAVSEKFPVVYVEDPQRNRIGQWLNVETKKGIAQESFLLTSEPRLGTYKLVAQRQRGSEIKQHFTVEEYVLPKYEVKVTVPSVITILDEEVEVTVCGKYTYGKPVAGKIDVQVCRRFTNSYSSCHLEEKSVCEDLSHQADKNGCFSEVVKTKIFQMKRSGYEMKLIASAKITEEGTGVVLTGEGSSEIKKIISKVSFRQMDSHFKKGIPYSGQIFLEDASGNPIPNKNVTIFIGSNKNFTSTTGPDGTADFSIDTNDFPSSSINLRAVYKTADRCYTQSTLLPVYEDALHTAQHFYSRTKSYIKIQPIYRTLSCEHDERFTVFYALTPEGVGKVPGVVFQHLVMAKGQIVDFGKNEVKLTSDQESHGQFTFTLPVNVNTAPLTRLLVYLVLESGEVIADTVSVKVEKCFTNKVKLSFSANEALPGSQVDLTLFAQPNSLCALRGVDVSVSLLKPEAELSAKTIYDLLPITDLSGYNHGNHYLEEEREDSCLKLDPIFMNGVYYRPSTPNWDTDTYAILQSLGLKVATNMLVRIPVICRDAVYDVDFHGTPEVAYMSRGMEVPMALSGRMHLSSLDDDYIVIETVRKLFPETWLWDMIEIDSIGHSSLKLTVPDSITTWKVGMFCTSEEEGFGLVEPTSFVTFQPFFLETTLPYSAIRGETFNLKATVFNYLKQTIRISISLEKSDEFTAKKLFTDKEDFCVEANDRVTVSWEVTLTSLGEVNFSVSAQTLPGEGLCGNEIVAPAQGRKDTIIKSILVEPEGVEKEETQNVMICGKDTETSEQISLKLPGQVVEGSPRAYFSAIGDIMGTSMQNLGNLLQLPFGCGEQNMVLFTPNIYILEYLNKTNQLTPEIKTKALSYLSTGYQKQLAYKHSDGSYSAFGPGYGRGNAGNTWLTAFVMKSFARARSNIFIDPAHTSETLEWLSRHQKENGCFQNVGYLFNNAMKGGVNDEVTLAAYTTIALLEYPLSARNIVVRNALFCLESAMNGENNIYTQALMAYAFTLAGKMELRSRLLQSLEEKAIRKDDTVHWHRPELSDNSELRAPHRRAASIEVEMTSYVLLSMLSKPNVTAEDLTAATKVVTWLIEQQNPTGGFSSTQDTVVALQALSLYGSHAVSHDGPRVVTMSLDNAQVAKFNVEDSNRLLLQKVPLATVPGEYIATVSGPGCVYLQTNLKYNVPHPVGEAPFTISVSTMPEICSVKSLKSFEVLVNVSYIGKREHSNMALVEIRLPSGYTPVKSSVKQLSRSNLISRSEAQPNKVIVYFEKLDKAVRFFTFSVEREIPVGNLQAATATILDYYETDDIAVTKYYHPCSKNGDETQNAE